MQKFIANTVLRIKNEEQLAYIRRVSWLDFEERIKNIFSKLTENKDNANVFGGFFLSSSQDYEPYFRKPYIYKTNSINQIQISTGLRVSGVHKAGKEGKTELITEKGSALWFSQDLSGGITAFLAPYSSQTHKVNEENIVIKIYRNPTAITEKELTKLVKTFIKYCEATVFSGAHSRRLYAFRLWLQLKDARNQKAIKAFIIKTAGQILAFLLAGLGVVATLYTGGVRW